MQDQTLAVTPNPPVARAIGLIWVALILYVVGVVLDAVNLASGNHSVDVAFVVIVTVAVWSFLIRKISEGENWARIVYLVLFLQWALRFLAKIDFHHFPALTTVGIVGMGLQAVALLWMFTDPGKKWFEPQRS